MSTGKVLLIVGGIGVVGVVIYMATRKAVPQSATYGRPINSLPARSYAMNPNYNPSARPPTPTYTPFSGAPVVEAVLKGFQSPSANDSSAQPFVPASFTDQASDWLDAQSNPVTSNDAGTSTYFG